MVEYDTGGILFDPDEFRDRIYSVPAVAPTTAAPTDTGASPSCKVHEAWTSNVVSAGHVIEKTSYALFSENHFEVSDCGPGTKTT